MRFVVMSGKEKEEERWTGVILSGGGGGTGFCKASRSFSPSGNTRGHQGRTSGTDGSISIASVGETRVLRCCLPLLVKGFGLFIRTLPSGVEARDCGRLCFSWPPEMKFRNRFFSPVSHFSRRFANVSSLMSCVCVCVCVCVYYVEKWRY